MSLTYRQQVMVVTMILTLFVLGLVVFGARLVAENIVAQREIENLPSSSASPSPDPDVDDLQEKVTDILSLTFDSYRLVSSSADVVAFVATSDTDGIDALALSMIEISELDGVESVTFVATDEAGEPYEPVLSDEQRGEGFTTSGNEIRLTR